jgi:alpha-L-fucosidase
MARCFFDGSYFCLLFTLAWRRSGKGSTPKGLSSENQIRWQEMEYYAFVHFSLNTYTDQSWGNGNEDVNLFNPTELDCRQWARVCKEAGMKGIIVTAKPCGFGVAFQHTELL